MCEKGSETCWFHEQLLSHFAAPLEPFERMVICDFVLIWKI